MGSANFKLPPDQASPTFAHISGFILLNKKAEVLGPAIIWLDLRAEAEAKDIAASTDMERLTGNELNPICVLPKLLWLHRHQPRVLEQASRILLVKDWLLWRLTGEFATDPSDAGSTAMTSPDGKAWDPRILALTGVAEDRLPPIRASASIGGRVMPEAAAATGLPVGTPVAVGAGDVTALAVGCGVVAPGRVAITLGTAGHVVAEGGGNDSIAELGL